MTKLRVCLAVFIAVPAAAQTAVDVVPVVSKMVERQVKLPGEIYPFLSVAIHSKVTGFVKAIDVDRGSAVKEGQLLATLEAPEIAAQISEAQAKARAVELQVAEAQARLSTAEGTYLRLRAASTTPGVVAINDLDIAEKSVEAARAVVQATQGSMEAAKASTQALRDLQGYLTIRAPFDGIVVERDVHPGALVGPASQAPLLKLQQVSHLRLTVAVPEAAVGGIVDGARVPFTVAAFPGVVFHGVVSRIAHSMDEATRSMAVELDVTNPDMKLAPGMYPEVTWPVRNPQSSLLVPPSSIVTTTERMFVIRVRNGVAEWVTVTRGAAAGDLVEVIGALKEGDLIVRRGSDELREGTPLKIVGKVAAAGAKVPLSSGRV